MPIPPSPSPVHLLLGRRRDGRPLRRTGSDAVLVGVLVLVLGFGGIAFSRWYRQGFSVGASGPLTQTAYLWQRQWTEPVRAAVQGFSREDSTWSALTVGVAEIAPATATPNANGAGGAVTLRAGDVDWPLLAGLGRPVGLAVRVRAFPGEVTPDREPGSTLRAVVDEMLGKAAAVGLKPTSFQVDFDCPPSRLRGVAAVLAALHSAHPEVPFVPTVDPAWLDSGDFAPLSRAAGGFVLQLGQLDRVGTDRRPPASRCDPVAANDAVRRAGRVGVPFSVSLPTFGYRVVVDAENRLVAISAEGPYLERQRPPAGGGERLLLAEPGEMARLVRGWDEARPATFRGILWDRLPVAGERLNWPMSALRAAAAGRVPRPAVRWQLSAPGEDERRELSLRSEGETDAILPPTLSVSCPTQPLEVEGINGYEISPPPPGVHQPASTLFFRRRAEDNADTVRGRLAPGEALAVARVRFPGDVDAPPGDDEIAGEMEPLPTTEAPAPTATTP